MEVNEVITNLNPLEYDIYFYLIQNKNMVISMKLKDLANQLHVSTAMITRVCQKLGFEGFGEYKAYLKLEEHEQVNFNTFQYIILFFRTDYLASLSPGEQSSWLAPIFSFHPFNTSR